jgi:hypothetical protein
METKEETFRGDLVLNGEVLYSNENPFDFSEYVFKNTVSSDPHVVKVYRNDELAATFSLTHFALAMLASLLNSK